MKTRMLRSSAAVVVATLSLVGLAGCGVGNAGSALPDQATVGVAPEGPEPTQPHGRADGQDATTGDVHTSQPDDVEPDLANACALLEEDEAAEFGVDPASATEIRGGEMPGLWREQASWCRWSSGGASGEARSLLLKLDRHYSPEAAAAGLAWLEQIGDTSHASVSTDVVPDLGHPATDHSGKPLAGALAASLVGSPNPASRHRDGSFVVARFGDTIVELSSTAGARYAERPDMPLPDLERRAFLVTALAERAGIEQRGADLPAVSAEAILLPMRTGGSAALAFDGLDLGPPLAVTCLGKSPGNTRAPGSVTVAYDGWTLFLSDGVVLLREYQPDRTHPSATYAWLGEAAALGGIEIERPGSGEVDAGPDFAPVALEVRAQGVGRYVIGSEPGGGDPATWTGFTDPDAQVHIVGTVDCDAADGDWWWTQPLRGRTVDAAPTPQRAPEPSSGPTSRAEELTSEVPDGQEPAPESPFPTPFCSAVLSEQEALAIVHGTLLSTDGHRESSLACEWMIDDGIGVDYVAFDIDHVELLTADEYFDATYIGRKPTRIQEDGPGDERFESRGGIVVRQGEWIVSVTAGLDGGRLAHNEMADLIITRLGLLGDS